MPHLLKLLVLLQVASTLVTAIPVETQSFRSFLKKCRKPFKSVGHGSQSDSNLSSALSIDRPDNSVRMVNEVKSSTGTAVSEAKNSVGMVNEVTSSARTAVIEAKNSAPGQSVFQNALKQGTTSPSATPEMDIGPRKPPIEKIGLKDENFW
ncbi:hypothetical protein PCANC_00576 [Puccinia coronata f. sp. avenae]|uniref:SMP domain-containing protein n=1 Tax=Puccinia coronata f. sp. avenae TaxID=200324 RepID=A0A2N5W7W8_9BASI|nr:hypothetical protein PCANC_00576 [Puccinia coronata f. sp. avenae]